MKNISYIVTASILLSLLALSGCGSDSTSTDAGNLFSDGRDMEVSFVKPAALALIPGLTATATLSPGDATANLTVSADTVSGTISGVTAGSYTLTLNYFVPHLTLENVDVKLATVTKDVTVTAGATTNVPVVDTDLVTDIDSDNDGFTNLAEIRIGTDPNSSSSLPGGPSPAFSAGNGSFADLSSTGFVVKGMAGEAVAGNYSTITATAPAYVISAGFKGF